MTIALRERVTLISLIDKRNDDVTVVFEASVNISFECDIVASPKP